MKVLLLAAVIGLGLACASAVAADLPVAPAPVAPDFAASAPPPPAYTWTGCYITAGAGYGMWTQDHYGETLAPTTQLTPTVTGSGEPWDVTAGAGCDYQIGSRWLIGGFGDYNYLGLLYGGTFEEPYTGWVGNETADGAWAVGGRIGYLLTPKLLTYISAGYTQAHFGQINLLTNSGLQGPPAGCGTGPCYIPAHNDGGWFIGGGTEFALSDLFPVNGLFWRIDYRYAAYSGVDLPILTSTGAPVTCVAAVACGEHMQKDYQIATTGLVWRFNVDGLPSVSAPAAAIPVTAGPGVGGASRSPPSLPSHAWCYVNGGAGYGMWEQDHYSNTGSTVTGSTGGQGWLGTVGVGCDYLVGSRWVIGALADFNFMNLSGRFQDPLLGYTGNQTENWAWAAGIRVGYLVTPDFLIYLNAGYPETHFNSINLVTASSASTPYYYPAHTYTSGFLFFGAGTEYALKDIVPLDGLFWRTEYRYADYTDVTLPLLSSGLAPSGCVHCGVAMAKDMQTITSGFVWRFYLGGS